MGNLFYDEPRGLTPAPVTQLHGFTIGQRVRVVNATTDGNGNHYDGLVGVIERFADLSYVNARYPITVRFRESGGFDYNGQRCASTYTFRATELEPVEVVDNG